MSIYDEKHPKHTLNNIKSIPLVKHDKSLENEDKFLKNLQKAQYLNRLNVSAERAAAKSQLIKLSTVAGDRLRKFKKERMQDLKNQAHDRYNSQEQFGGARTDN